jgi:hypothetical protein
MTDPIIGIDIGWQGAIAPLKPAGDLLEQIREWDLPTRPTKTGDSRSKDFGDISVELDACRRTGSAISLTKQYPDTCLNIS